MSLRSRLPRWLYAVLAFGLAALFVRLAVWQYHRGQERAGVERAAAAARHQRAAPLDAARAATLPLYAHVYAEGRYLGGRQVLLAEMPQPDGEGTGFDVLTPFALAGGATLLVNRGWVPERGPRRADADLAVPAGTVVAAGYLSDLPAPGLRLGAPGATTGAGPAVLLYPRWSDLERLYGRPLVRRLLLLQPRAPGGYDRNWELRPEHGPAENYSYMAQWAGMAAAVIVLWLTLALRQWRRDRHG